MTGYGSDAMEPLVRLADRALLQDDVVSAFVRMGATVVPALIGMLGGDERAIDLALRTLTELGPAAHPALPALTAHPRAASVEFVRVRAAITAPGPDPKTGTGRS